MSESYRCFEKFCSLLNNQNILKKMPALSVQGQLQQCVEEIKISTLQELLHYNKDKIDIYIDLKVNQIKQQNYIKDFGPERIEKWLDYFKIEIKDVLEFDYGSDSFKDLVGGYYLNHRLEEVPNDKLEDYRIAKEAQEDFLLYFLDYYSKQLISFLESQKSTKTKNNDIKVKQLSSNQIVLMLQEIGFFTHPKIEDATKVKQSKLISLIVGLNDKNIKTNIEKLDKNPSKNGVNYQKDIAKINKLLDDLI